MRRWSLAAVVLPILAPMAAAAADNPLLGTWAVTEATMAPWVARQSPEETAEIARMMGLAVAFEADRVTADAVVGCTQAQYEATSLPPEGLFQGSLPEGRQAAAAAGLGLPAGAVPGVDVACSTGLFSYHFRDQDTVLFGLDNVVYTLKRK